MNRLPFFCVRIPTYLLLVVALLLSLMFLYVRSRRLTNGRPWQWLRARYGWGLKIEELARRLGMAAEELRALQPSYKETLIAKKRGGQRRLLIPDAKLKNVQRRILHRLLRKLRSHPAATGFEKGKSIVNNALPHVGRKVVIKLDVVNFFPSIRTERIEAYFRRIGWNAECAALLTKLCTYEGGLPQGAPTSPRLSNLVNFQFDSRLERFVVQRRKGAYTRYADDITISFPKDYPRRIRGTIQYVRRVARAFGYEIHVHQKLRILRPFQQQRVTGLVVNQKVQLPRKKRRRLRAVAHHLRTGRAATLSQMQLDGWVALEKMIEKQTTQSITSPERTGENS